jgi:hypothetical protein
VIVRVVAALGVFLAVASPAFGQRSDADDVVERCVTRDTATAWMRMSAEWSREPPGSWTNDSLRNVLIAMGNADQAVRPAVGWADSIRDPAFVRRMHVQDSINAQRLREIIDRFGWPTKTMVGARGASAAFLITQHNASLQALGLRLMRALPPREVQQSELAMLEDRVLVSQGKPQKYGTQLNVDGTEFAPVDSLSRLADRRAEAGLPPMPVYLCMIRGFTGREARPPTQATSQLPVLKFRRYWHPHARVHFGEPQRASVAAGAMYVLDKSGDLTRWSGILGIVEPGIDAGKVRLGYGSSGASATGVSGTLAALYHWGDGAWSERGRVHLGGELHLSLMYVDVGFGWYQALQSGKLRFAFSVGAGI